MTVAPQAIDAMAILTDVTKCIGCEECVTVCKKLNQTGKDLPWPWKEKGKIDDLSASRWTTVLHRKLPETVNQNSRIKPSAKIRYVRQQCRHCLECVMLYLAVLALEFSPVVLERTPFK